MRWTLLLLLAAAFAGCIDETPDGADDPSMGMPVPGSDVNDTEVLPEDDTRPADGQGFAPQSGHQESSSDVVSLVGDLRVEDCGDSFCIHAVATNEGSQDLYVHDICITSWSESMQQRQSDVQKTEPVAVCEAWGLRAMEAGEMMEANFTWDGRLWDEDAQEYRDAPEDQYTWSIHFVYYTSAEGDGREELTIDFPVIIGET